MPDMRTLVKELEEIVTLLRRYGENEWSARIDDDLFFLRKNDAYGAQRFLTYFGGMGSLQDLMICPENGHPVSPSEASVVNQKLASLLSGAYELARKCSNGEA